MLKGNDPKRAGNAKRLNVRQANGRATSTTYLAFSQRYRDGGAVPKYRGEKGPGLELDEVDVLARLELRRVWPQLRIAESQLEDA